MAMNPWMIYLQVERIKLKMMFIRGLSRKESSPCIRWMSSTWCRIILGREGRLQLVLQQDNVMD